MKAKRIIILVFMALLIMPFCSRSQEDLIIMKRHRPHSKHLDMAFITNDRQSDTTVILIFEENAPERFNAPKTPSFALMSKQKKFIMGVGGYVKATASMDFDGAINNPAYFITSAIPVPAVPGNSKLMQFNANQTTLFYNLVSLSPKKNKFGAYININFSGQNFTPVLQDAYVTYGGFLIGRTTSLFTDAAAIPPTIDSQGPDGMIFLYNNVFNYRHSFGRHLSAGIGLEMPVADYTVNSDYQSVSNQYIPDIPAYIQFAWGNGNNSHVRLSGILRNTNYYNKVDDKENIVTTLGGQLSGLTTIANKVIFYYQCSYGKGLSTYIQDLNGLGLDFLPVTVHEDNTVKNEIKTADAMSYYVGLQYNFNLRTFVSCTYSQVAVLLPDMYEDSNLYKEGYYLAANFFWYAAPNVQLGVEYIYGKRVNQDKQWGNANRAQFMVQYNF